MDAAEPEQMQFIRLTWTKTSGADIRSVFQSPEAADEAMEVSDSSLVDTPR